MGVWELSRLGVGSLNSIDQRQFEGGNSSDRSKTAAGDAAEHRGALMAGTLARPVLRVEGKNDLFVIANLLRRHDVDCDPKTKLFDIETAEDLSDAGTESVDALLEYFQEAVLQSAGRPIGFVLDANGDLSRRWKQVSTRLKKLGVVPPEAAVPAGLIARVDNYDTTVGVWIMPDNKQPGKLEDLLRGLIGARNRLIRHAEAATDQAINHGAKYRKVDRIKAVLHTWLARQRVPGHPFGTAVNARYFGHASPAAKAFVAWFKALYGIS
jgi:hypothetical protein